MEGQEEQCIVGHSNEEKCALLYTAYFGNVLGNLSISCTQKNVHTIHIIAHKKKRMLVWYADIHTMHDVIAVITRWQPRKF